MEQSGGFFCRLLHPLLKTGLPLIEIVIKLLAKVVLTSLGLTAAASAADLGIHKKILGSGHRHFPPHVLRPPLCNAPHNTTLIISSDELKDIVEIVKSLEDSGLLIKGVSETIQNEAKEQKGGFLSMLFGTFGAILLGNILAGKRMNRAGERVVEVVMKIRKVKKQ